MVSVNIWIKDALQYYQAGNTAVAEELYRKALDKEPKNIEALFGLGMLYSDKGENDAAGILYEEIIAAKSDSPESLYNLGNTFKKLGQLEKAALSYNKAIALKLNYAEAWLNLGTVLQKQGKFNEAELSYKHVVALDPDNYKAFYNLGNACRNQGKIIEAAGNYQSAIKVKPNFVEAYTNLGHVLKEQGKLNDALEMYNKAISLKPDFASARWNRALTLLLTGNFEQGWKDYDYRFLVKELGFRVLSGTSWDGSNLNGKTILVHAEQGVGDTFQFIRFLPMVKKQGGHVIFECTRNLSPLLKNCKGFDEITERGTDNNPVVSYDVHIPLLSLPKLFGIPPAPIPNAVPYIKADPELVRKWGIRITSLVSDCRSANDFPFRIGIVWAGNPTHGNDKNRSCLLADFEPLKEIHDAVLISLQKGDASSQLDKPPEGMSIINLDNEINSFSDTAAIIVNLDLVLTVDTAVAHLAGAIGKEVWTLLPYLPDWRWSLSRTDSPWYHGMKLYRQRKPGDWASVIKYVADDLKKRNI